MKTQKEQSSICLMKNELATWRHSVGTGLVKAALAMPRACSPEHMINVEVASPRLIEFEHQEAARKIKETEEDRLKREREATRFRND
ncbi:MAG: hypothetical protein DRP65_00060 [Planctomycetota bacterium]|nr:MAG: hypothetical protein DRP65_00060 [Planctomycetota bacterium]